MCRDSGWIFGYSLVASTPGLAVIVLLRLLLLNMLPLVLLSSAIGYTLVGEEGLLNRHTLKLELYASQAQVHRIEGENEVLRARISALRQDPAAVRRVAAESLLMADPGSTIFRFQGK